MLAGLDQQIMRNLPPTHELVAKGQPARAVNGDGVEFKVTFLDDLPGPGPARTLAPAWLELTRDQILGHRRAVSALEERLPPGPDSLRHAAWAGLSDSMPRAAVLSIHARVEGTAPDAWADPTLVQLWGPRFSAYVVAAEDVGVFTLGRLPDEPGPRRRAFDTADRVAAFLQGRVMRFGEAGHAMGVTPNSLRYGAPTGTVLIRWDGARQPTIWTVPPPDIAPEVARLELARRYLHVFGPGTPAGFGDWAGVRPTAAAAAFAALEPTLIPARTSIGDGWILAEDEASFRGPAGTSTSVRLLPSGDTYFLLQGRQRELLIPEPDRRARLWTSRVWPGALLVAGEIVGTWRRAQADVSIEAWRRLSASERTSVEAEATSIPLPGLPTPIRVHWTG